MSRRIIVSIISEQTLPNYLFIKELQKEVDRYIFITTEKMESFGKTDDICQTAGISKKQRNKILVDENAMYKIVERLNKLGLSKDDEYLVNITGGTKLMSIAVWNYFKGFPKSRFFYIPIGKNTYKEVFDNKEAEETTFKYQISVDEYLKIYAINFVEEKRIFSEHQAENLFNDVKSTQYDLLKFPKDKVKKLGIKDYDVQQIHTKWFEEFLYYRIKKVLRLPDSQIKTGIKLFHKNRTPLHGEIVQNDNEIDVFFIYKNNPYLVEAKFSIGQNKINTITLNNILYKLAAVNKRFGLRATATLMTLSDFSLMGENAKKNLEFKCKLLNLVYPFDRNQIINVQNFKQNLLNKFVK